jgi:peptide/nickel transport system permease protein
MSAMLSKRLRSIIRAGQGYARPLLKSKKLLVSVVTVVLFTLLGIFGPFFVVDPLEYTGTMYEAPSWAHLLGTDVYGRDIFSQLLYGIRNTMLVGVIAGTIGLLIAIVLGGFSGYIGGLAGESINALANIFLVIPAVPLLIVFSALVKQRSLFLVAIFIAIITSWPGTTRAIRAQVMSLREKEFVNLARITGKKAPQIVFGEIFSNMISYISLQFCGAFASAIITEAGLSLLGLGPTTVVTLGMMLHWAIASLAQQLGIWWWLVPPGLVLTVLSAALYTISSLIEEVKQD